MKHIQFSISANEFQQEELISFLNDHDPSGYEQRETELVAYFPADDFRVKEVEEILKGYSFTKEAVEAQNWNQVWESNFDPVIVEDFCAVRADFHAPIKNVEHEIIITPKMSFGTGHHATTYMMMKQMREMDFRGKTVFDFGTGTGILAILAEKMGAATVEAIDMDEWSIENATENFERNGCRKIRVKKSSMLPTGTKFDIILANINRNVILDYMNQLSSTVVNKGVILFSGLLASDADDIVNAAKEFGLLRKEERNNWVSLLFVKES